MKTVKLCSFVFVALALVLFVGPARATVYNLSDQNSALTIDASNQAGAYGWVVDGTSVLYQQWFWYRIGNTGPEKSIDTLPLISATLLGTADLTLLYGSASPGGFTISVQYDLTGGSAGSLTSDVAETIRINNYGAGRLFHFFQYSDFDLARNLVDTVKIDPGLQDVHQAPAAGFFAGPMLSETIVGPKPSHAEANYYANTLGELNDLNPTTLDGVLTAGPGDVTWAFQWDKTIAAGGSFLISKDKQLTPLVPEPATILGFGAILLLVGRKLSRRPV